MNESADDNSGLTYSDTTPSRNATQATPSRAICGIPIHAVTMDDTLEACKRAVATGQPLNIACVNVAKLVKVQNDPVLRDSVLSADLTIPDGAPIVWASRILRRPLPERVAGIDLFERLLEVSGQSSWRVYFLGATDEVLEDVLARVRRDHPGLVVSGAKNGYFDPSEAASVADEVAATQPDVIFVAITSPKKERFLKLLGERTLIPVAHGVGGSFDVYAGKTKRAPVWMQRTGLEWFFRILQEPRRMWRRYAVTNTLFLLLLGRNILRPQPEFPCEGQTP